MAHRQGSSSPLPNRGATQTFHLFPKLPTELRLKVWNMALPPPRIVPIKCGSRSISMSPPPSAISQAHQHAYSHSNPPSPPSPSSSSPGCTSPAPIPTTLHACRESRTESLRTYRLMFGIGRQPGRVFFAPDRDILYFGPRDGYMASDAQFRTLLTLARPEELAAVRYLALNEALFRLAELETQTRELEAGCPCVVYDRDRNAREVSPLWVRHLDFVYQSSVAESLTASAIEGVRARMPGLEELIFVPRDENPVYSAGAVLVEPPVPQGALERQIEKVIDRVVGAGGVETWVPPRWRILGLASEPRGEWYGNGCGCREGEDEVVTWSVESYWQESEVSVSWS